MVLYEEVCDEIFNCGAGHFAVVMDSLADEVRQESLRTVMFADDIMICSEIREGGGRHCGEVVVYAGQKRNSNSLQLS